MSSSFIDKLTLAIGIGTDVSSVIKRSQYHDSASIGILAPAVLDAHTFIIQVTDDPDATSVVWRTLKDRDGNTAFVPSQGEACWYPDLVGFGGFRIKDTTGNVAATRTFDIIKHHTI